MMGKIDYAKNKHKKTGEAILISYKIDLKTRTMAKDKW